MHCSPAFVIKKLIFLESQAFASCARCVSANRRKLTAGKQTWMLACFGFHELTSQTIVICKMKSYFFHYYFTSYKISATQHPWSHLRYLGFGNIRKLLWEGQLSSHTHLQLRNSAKIRAEYGLGLSWWNQQGHNIGFLSSWSMCCSNYWQLQA